MPRQLLQIPLNRGIDQTLDEWLRPPDSLAVALNGYYRRNNALTKRHGFTALPTQTFGGPATPGTYGTPKGLFSTGEELCIRGHRQLYAATTANPQLGITWWTKGDLSPFTGRQRGLFSDSRSVGSCDVAVTPGFVGSAVTTYNQANSGTDYDTSLIWTLETTDGEVLQNRQVILNDPSSTAQQLNITGCRVVNDDTAAGGAPALFLGVQLEPVAPAVTATLRWYRWQATALTTLPQQVIQHTDMIRPDYYYNWRHYDACPGPNNSGWGYAYCRQTSAGGAPLTGTLEVYSKSNIATNATISIPAPAPYDYWLACSLVYGALGQQWYVVGLAVDTATNNRAIILYALNTTTLAVNWGPVVVQTGAVGRLYGPSVVEGLDNSGNFRVVVSYCRRIVDASSTADFPSVEHAQYSTLGVIVAPGLLPKIRNTEPLSKPWFHGGRCYQAMRFVAQPSAGTFGVDGYSGEAIVDLGIGDTESAGPPPVARIPRIVGRYDFGAMAAYNTVAQIEGSLQQVTREPTASTRYRYATERMVLNSGAQVVEQLIASDEIALDFAGVVTQAATTRGTATLGGGLVNWYAGAVTEELGWISSPFIVSLTAVAHGSGTLAAGTYTYVTYLESWDEQGMLTRSLPSPPAQVTFAGGGGANAVQLDITTLGPTSRYGKRRFGLGVFRAGSDGVFRRCMEPGHLLLDSEAFNLFYPLPIDRGETYDVLYTQGGAELEAAGPDGAAFVSTTSKRVWLSGFFRRDRVAYSKGYDPSTANEYALAPEYNDAFAFLLPGGENVTGMAELDDKVIIFTKSNIYAIAGNGPDDGGRNNDFSGLQLIASDTGCVDARSVVATPLGVFFQSPSGMFVLGRDLALDYIGAAVRDITDVYTEVTSAVLVPAANHVRFTLRQSGESGTILIFDFDQKAWIQWTPQRTVGVAALPINMVGACLHQGTYYVLASDGTVFKEDASTYFDDGTIYVPMRIETGWLQATNQSGWQRIRRIAALCRQQDAHELTIFLYQDFETISSQSFTWNHATISAQKLTELVEMHVARQKCTSFRIVIQDAVATGDTTTGQGYDCTGFAVELGGKAGLYKPGPQQRN